MHGGYTFSAKPQHFFSVQTASLVHTAIFLVLHVLIVDVTIHVLYRHCHVQLCFDITVPYTSSLRIVLQVIGLVH